MNFTDTKILVIGDLMLDHYIKGAVKRISPEAPVPIVMVEEESETLGGAANVAANIASLGGKVIVACVLGDDAAKGRARSLLAKSSIKTLAVVDPSRLTTMKSRVIGLNQQLLRMDYEVVDPLSEPVEHALFGAVKRCIVEDGVDVVVLSDYAKGVLTPSFLAQVFSFCAGLGVKTVIDPKPGTIRYCRGCFLMTPNHIEASGHVGIPEENGEGIVRIGHAIQEELGCHVLVTRGEKGVALFESDQAPLLIPTEARRVFDVTGAGDTVTALVALGLASGWSLSDAVRLANKGAGIVVGKFGTQTLSLEELQGAFSG